MATPERRRYAGSNPIRPSNSELPGAADLNFGYQGHLPGSADPFLGAQTPEAPDWTGQYADRLPGAPNPVADNYTPELPGAPQPLVGDYRPELPGAPDLMQQIAPPPVEIPPSMPPEPMDLLSGFEAPQAREWQLNMGAEQTRAATYWN